MASEWFSCKGPCAGSDPVSDTVKVDFSKLASEKENVQPMQVQNKTDEMQKREEKRRAQEELARQQQKEAEQRRQAEEQARRRREEEEAERLRKEKVVREAAERAAAEAAAAAAAEAAALAKAAEEKERLRLEAERAAEEKARQEQEEAERAAHLEAQRLEEERLAHEKVSSWCKANGFGDMNSKKKSFLGGSKFPLHEAVAKGNEEMVGLMVQLGADKGLKNSKGQTPEDLARKMNKAGSMDSILAKLE